MRKSLSSALMLFALLLSPAAYSEHQKVPISDEDIKAVALAIEDEIYDYGYQIYEFGDVGRRVANEKQEIRIYVRPFLEQGKDLGEVGKGEGQVIYKLMPFGEVFRFFSIEKDGAAIVYGNPEFGFHPEHPNYLTVYMDDDDLCQFKHDWLKSSYVIQLHPSAERLHEAAERQRKRIGHSVRENPGSRFFPPGIDPRCGENRPSSKKR